MRIDDKAGLLYDFAASRPDGFTYRDIEEAFGWRRDSFFDVVHKLRLMFADDSINLVCEPQAAHEPWLYRLVGTNEDARGWAANRIGDLETRLETIQAVAMSLTNATDGRTIEGRKARKVHRTITRLIEDLTEISESPPVNGSVAA